MLWRCCGTAMDGRRAALLLLVVVVPFALVVLEAAAAAAACRDRCVTGNGAAKPPLFMRATVLVGFLVGAVTCAGAAGGDDPPRGNSGIMDGRLIKMLGRARLLWLATLSCGALCGSWGGATGRGAGRLAPSTTDGRGWGSASRSGSSGSMWSPLRNTDLRRCRSIFCTIMLCRSRSLIGTRTGTPAGAAKPSFPVVAVVGCVVAAVETACAVVAASC